jgi:hypothetical protein
VTLDDSLRDSLNHTNELCGQGIKVLTDFNTLAQQIGPTNSSARPSGGNSTNDHGKPLKKSWIRYKPKLLRLAAQATAIVTPLSNAMTILQNTHTSFAAHTTMSHLAALIEDTTIVRSSVLGLEPQRPLTNEQTHLATTNNRITELELSANNLTGTDPLTDQEQQPQSISPKSSIALCHTAASMSTIRASTTAERPPGPALDTSEPVSIGSFRSATPRLTDSSSAFLSIRSEPGPERCKLFCSCQCHIVSQH